MSEADWAHALRKPAGLMLSLLPPGLTVRRYGWHLVQAKEEVVIGFAKLPEDRLQGTLVRSGLKGGFFAHLGKTEDRVTVCWMPRGKSNNSIDYLSDTRQQADVANVGLPAGQSGFKCPLCDMHIPCLASQDRKRAKRHHLETTHPDFKGGLDALHALSLKGRPLSTQSVSNRNKAEHAARRKTDFSTHTIVEVPTAESNARGQRGTAHYCKVCLTQLSKRTGVGATMTCHEMQERLRTNPHSRRLRLCWWVRLNASDPMQADALCQAVGRPKRDMDRECFMFEPHTDRSRGWARKRFLEGAKPQFRKRGKQPLLRCEAAAPVRTYSDGFFKNLQKARQARRKKAPAAKAPKPGRKVTLKRPAAATHS